MLKLKDFLIHYCKLAITAWLISLLLGCGSGGGGSDNAACIGSSCVDDGVDTLDGDDTDEADEEEIEDEGSDVADFEESISVPDSDGFSFAADRYNPEAYDYNNVAVEVTINLNDFEGNPPPDGSTVLFDAEAGTIPTRCLVEDGSCSVTWLSGSPRPGFGTNPLGEADGRFIIFVRVLGSESFIDLDNDDRFDGIGVEPFEDLPEPFLDINENGRWDAGEEFEDSPGGVAGEYDGADGLYNGPRCDEDCSPNTTIYLGGRNLGSFTFVMSTSAAAIFVDTDDEILRDYDPLAATTTPLPPENTVIDITAGEQRFDNVYIGDLFGNSMSSGSTIEIAGENIEVVGRESYEISDVATAAQYIQFSIRGDDTSGTDGELTITVTSGEQGRETVFTWPVTD